MNFAFLGQDPELAAMKTPEISADPDSEMELNIARMKSNAILAYIYVNKAKKPDRKQYQCHPLKPNSLSLTGR
jgi:hypothetical protein